MLEVVIEADGIRIGARLGISFHRTLRVPDDGRAYPLPPGLGRFPVRRVSMAGAGEVAAIPMYRREALWIGFAGAHWKPNAVKVLVGGINAVSGLPDDGHALGAPQDYLVCPAQPWLDGLDAGGGLIRQFVAMPLGEGYGVEASYPDLVERGGLEIVAFEPHPGRFPDHPPPRPEGPERLRMPRPAEAAPRRLALGAGGSIRQKVYPDPHGRDTWDTANSGRARVILLEANSFAALTGVEPPPTPVEPATYTAHGLPWFDLYDEDAGTVEPAEDRRLVTIRDRDKARDAAAEQGPAFDVPDTQVRKIGRRTTTPATRGKKAKDH
jgi:hypothetical protein